MTRNTARTGRRRGVAALELAILMPFLLALMVGLWEVGRVVSVHNVLANAAREGARLAGSGGYFSSSKYNDPVTGLALDLDYSQDSSGNSIPYDIQKRVLVYLTAANISTTGATVKVENLDKSWTGTYPTGTSTPATGTSTGSYDPAAAADQLNHLRVTVQVPYSSIQWSTLGLFVLNNTTLTAAVDVYSLRNKPFSVSTTIPQQVQ